MIDSGPACPWGRENRGGQGRRATFMHECMDEPEDAGPATICSVIQGCGGLESVISTPAQAAEHRARVMTRERPEVPADRAREALHTDALARGGGPAQLVGVVVPEELVRRQPLGERPPQAVLGEELPGRERAVVR